MPQSPRIRITERIVRFLVTIGEYGVLSLELCHAKLGPQFTAEWCREILARLTAAGLIGAVALRVWHDDKKHSGRIPLLYFLRPDGAEVVLAETGRFPRHVLRSEPSTATFYHRLCVVRIRISFETAAERAGLSPPRFLTEQDLRTDVPTDAMPQHRCLLHHEFRETNGRVVTCRPDAAAVLTIPRPSGDTARSTDLAIHFEIDRSTEGVAQCERKLPGYTGLYQQRAFMRYWPDLRSPVHRVFWVVPSAERIESLSAAFRRDPVASYFRFTTFGDCQPDRVLTQPVWRDCRGTPMTLYQPADPQVGKPVG